MLRRLKIKKEDTLNISYKLSSLLALSAGLYPLIYLYTNNFTLVSSWYQFLMLALFFIAMPILVFNLLNFISLKFNIFYGYIRVILVFFNLSLFAILCVYSTIGLSKKIIPIIIVITCVLSFYLVKHILKLVKFQLLLGGIGIIFLFPMVFNYYNQSDDWFKTSDDFLKLKFEKKPNIYVLQPDGYIGFSEMKSKIYNFDNIEFNSFLKFSGFTLYPNYRSNYPSTLSSNSAMFAMKHHYYNYNASKTELLFARDIIVGDNAVLSILKNNGYKTSLILENSYLLVNRPKITYDYCNISFDEMSIMGNGFDLRRDTKSDLEKALNEKSATPGFYFIERISPGHIATYEPYSKGKELERLKYLDKIKEANRWLIEMVNLISSKDPSGLVIIASDHGGFVGYNYTAEAYSKPENIENANSMFSSILAIKWPDDQLGYDKDISTSVNLFKIIFSYLSEEKKLLELLEEDNSYLKIHNDEYGNNPGIYEVINNEELVFKKIDH